MRRWAIIFALGLGACVSGYEDGLGYRARQAVLRKDAAAFDPLMKEAVEKVPAFPRDKPERTVLTHFLDLAADPLFYPTVKDWIAKDWISENLTCAVEKARARHEDDPAAVKAATQIILDRARNAAYTAGRSWEIDACLEYAPFLTVTSTVALRPFLAIAADPLEPRAFRARMLNSMTDRYLQDVFIRKMNHPELPFAGHRAEAAWQREQEQRRFVGILNAVAGEGDAVLIASGTARFALELERASHTEGQSFLYDYAFREDDPARRDLVWAWVRSLKARDVDRRLESLGIWDRSREPGRDTYWYGCGKAEVEPVFSRAQVTLQLKRSENVLSDPRVAMPCAQDHFVAGPYPLASVARYAVTASVAEYRQVDRVRTRLLPLGRVRTSTIH